MSCSIRPVEEEQCVFLTCEGEMPPIEALAVRYEVSGLLAEKSWNRIVVDVTELQSAPRALESFEFARGLSSDLPPSARAALVVRPDQVRHAKLVQDVARHDGVFLTFFSDPDEATTWVKSQKPRQSL
jgi:hypothetical protein